MSWMTVWQWNNIKYSPQKIQGDIQKPVELEGDIEVIIIILIIK